jgi:hypothetical protein
MQWSWPALMNGECGEVWVPTITTLMEVVLLDDDEDDAMVEDLTPTQGNLNRSLWRKMCRAIAGNVSCLSLQMSSQAGAL